MLIFPKFIHGFMTNSIKKSWTVSSEAVRIPIFLQGSAVVFGGGLFVWWCLTIASRLVSWRGLRTRRAVSGGGHLLS